jgi:glycosyltransferase involved in cell wall biosynthesis
MTPLTATVIVPTSIDRGPTLRLAVESVLAQTVQDIEVLIIGDGVHPVTRECALALERADARVRFFDHPKHERRGEPYRDEALKVARGRIVCYCCDRDLYLPHHVEEMARLLEDSDVANGLPVRVLDKIGLAAEFAFDLAHPEDRKAFLVSARSKNPVLGVAVPLSVGAHTLAAYRRLAEGWSPTPPDVYTDLHFWAKFVGDPQMRLRSGYRITVLSFPRGMHPGLSTAKRFEELTVWAGRLKDPQGVAQLDREAMEVVIRDRAWRGRLMRRAIEFSLLNLRWLQAGK